MTQYALRMRRPEVNTATKNGAVAVLPTGSLEQHGRHLPVGTDTLLAETLVREAVDRAAVNGTRAIAFPAIWTGFSPHHLPLGATVSIERDTFLDLIDDVCSSLIEVGFETILIVNGHGGNAPATSLAAGDIGTRQSEADVAELSYVALAEDQFADLRDGPEGSAYHAGEVETSLMLHLYDELVAMDAAADDPECPLTSHSPRDMFRGGPVGMRRTYDRLTNDGVRGSPTAADAETGRELFEGVSGELAAIIYEVSELD